MLIVSVRIKGKSNFRLFFTLPLFVVLALSDMLDDLCELVALFCPRVSYRAADGTQRTLAAALRPTSAVLTGCMWELAFHTGPLDMVDVDVKNKGSIVTGQSAYALRGKAFMKLILKWFYMLWRVLGGAGAFSYAGIRGRMAVCCCGARAVAAEPIGAPIAAGIVPCPLSMLTFGLFFFIVNAWMVSITDALLPFLRVDGFWIRLFVALLVSIGNAVLIGARHRRIET